MKTKLFFHTLFRLGIGFAMLFGLLGVAPHAALAASPNGTDGVVYAVAMNSGRVYAGGAFATAGGNPAANIAYHEGALWMAMGAGVNGAVYAMAIDSSGRVYVGGDFTTAGGINANHVARWDPASKAWSAVGVGVNGRVKAMAFDSDGNLYVGGDFTALGNGAAVKRLAKFSPSSGGWSDVKGGTNNVVQALQIYGSRLYVGGNFTKVDNGTVAVGYIAYYDLVAKTWNKLVQKNIVGVNYRVYALTVDPAGNLVVGGEFTAAGPYSIKYAAVFNPTTSTWGSLGGDFNAPVRALAYKAGVYYAGGDFTKAGSTTLNYVAQFVGGNWQPMGSGMNQRVRALVADAVVAGGEFTIANGVAANYITIWDGSSWAALINNPTPVALGALDAQPVAGGVEVTWVTLQEIGISGFSILRSSDGVAYARISPNLILSKSPGSLMGAEYAYLDGDVQSGVTYFYQLEVVNANGMKEIYGPVQAAP